VRAHEVDERLGRLVATLGVAGGVGITALGAVAVRGGDLSVEVVAAWVAVSLLGAASLRLLRAGRRSQWVLAWLVISVVTVAPEWMLRVGGFRYESGIEFGFPRPEHFHRFVRDAQLLWTLDPAVEGVNARGLPGAELSVGKERGTFRILYLGDSCTYEKAHLLAYPSLVQERRASRAKGVVQDDYVSLAVPGYSTHQGRVLAERYGASLDADVAVVLFGWNDHWLAYGQTDSEKVVVPTQGARVANWAHVNLRLVQFASWLVSSQSQVSSEGGRVLRRVPAPEFERNLRAVARVFQSQGVPVVLVTAPSTHREFGVPSYLVERGFTPDEATAIADHEQYQEVVRTLAAAEGVLLLDLADRLADVEPSRLGALFRADGIHFSPVGAAWVAREVDAFIEGHVSR